MLTLLTVLIAPTAAWAHAFLDHADPRVGSSVSRSPDVLTLAFTEGVEPAFSHVEVSDESGRRMKVGPLVHPQPATLTVTLPRLTPGHYTVVWSVLSVDRHTTEGRFTFAVGR